VELVASHLRINVGGTFVVDQDFPLAVRSGAVGLGVLNDQATTFDDVKLRILTP
jgi:hypothetical protein